MTPESVPASSRDAPAVEGVRVDGTATPLVGVLVTRGLTAATVLALQATAGNRAVTALLDERRPAREDPATSQWGRGAVDQPPQGLEEDVEDPSDVDRGGAEPPAQDDADGFGQLGSLPEHVENELDALLASWAELRARSSTAQARRRLAGQTRGFGRSVEAAGATMEDVAEELRERTQPLQQAARAALDDALRTYLTQCWHAAAAEVTDGDRRTVSEPFTAAVATFRSALQALLDAGGPFGAAAHLDFLNEAESLVDITENLGVAGDRAINPRGGRGRRVDLERLDAEQPLLDARVRAFEDLLEALPAAAEWGVGPAPPSLTTPPAEVSGRSARELTRRLTVLNELPWEPPANRQAQRRLASRLRDMQRWLRNRLRPARNAADRARTNAEGERRARAAPAAAAAHAGEQLAAIGGSAATWAEGADTDARARVYARAMHFIATGFDTRLDRIHVRLPIIQAQAEATSGSRGLGFGHRGFGTYAGHGAGAFDLHGTAGDDVVCVFQPQLDLGPYLISGMAGPVPVTPAIGGTVAPGARGQLYDWQRATVRVTRITEARDLLAKLAYGLFGRQDSEGRAGRSQAGSGADIAGRLETAGGAASLSEAVAEERGVRPDHRRTLAALLFHHATGPGRVSALAANRTAVLDQLAPLVRAEAASEFGVPAESLNEAAVFQAVDASEGTPNLQRGIAGEIVNTILAARSGPPLTGRRADAERNRIRNRISVLAVRVLGTAATPDGPLRLPLYQLLLDAYGAVRHEAGDQQPSVSIKSGASVSVTHVYERVGGGDTVDIRIDYRHLSQVAEELDDGDEIRASGERLGTVGTTGNAVSVHIHMEIALSRNGQPLGFVHPVHFFGTQASILPGQPAAPGGRTAAESGRPAP